MNKFIFDYTQQKLSLRRRVPFRNTCTDSLYEQTQVWKSLRCVCF